MGCGGYIQIYNGTAFKWVRDRNAASVQVDYWSEHWPMEILPNHKYSVYIEFKNHIFINHSRTIAKVHYTFAPVIVPPSAATSSSTNNATTTTNNNNTNNNNTNTITNCDDMWIEFKAIAKPDYDILVTLSPQVQLVLPTDNFNNNYYTYTASQHVQYKSYLQLHLDHYQDGGGNDDDGDGDGDPKQPQQLQPYIESLGWGGSLDELTYFYLTECPWVPQHYLTTLRLPQNYQISYNNWMTQHYHFLKSTPLHDLCLPGSHDSGMYTITSNTFGGTVGNTVTQSLSVYDQLQSGCRFLDLRPTLYKDTFYMGHYSKVSNSRALGSNGPSFNTIIDEINRFTEEGNNELIIIALSHDFDCNDGYRSFYPSQWNQLFDLFFNNLNHLYAPDGPRLASQGVGSVLGVDGNTDDNTTNSNSETGNDNTTTHNPDNWTGLMAKPLSHFLPPSPQNPNLPSKPCILITVEYGRVATPPNSSIFNLSPTTIQYFDKYSNTNVPTIMMDRQIRHLIQQTFPTPTPPNLPNNNNRSTRLFMLNWILTQTNDEAIWTAFGLGKDNCDLLSRAEKINVLLQFDLLLTSLHYEQHWSRRLLQSQQSSSSQLQHQPPQQREQQPQQHHGIFTPTITIYDDDDHHPNNNQNNKLIPNIIFVDGFTAAITRYAVLINLFHSARHILAAVYQALPKTTDFTLQKQHMQLKQSTQPPPLSSSRHSRRKQRSLQPQQLPQRRQQQHPGFGITAWHHKSAIIAIGLDEQERDSDTTDTDEEDGFDENQDGAAAADDDDGDGDDDIFPFAPFALPPPGTEYSFTQPKNSDDDDSDEEESDINNHNHNNNKNNNNNGLKIGDEDDDFDDDLIDPSTVIRMPPTSNHKPKTNGSGNGGNGDSILQIAEQSTKNVHQLLEQLQFTQDSEDVDNNVDDDGPARNHLHRDFSTWDDLDDANPKGVSAQSQGNSNGENKCSPERYGGDDHDDGAPEEPIDHIDDDNDDILP